MFRDADVPVIPLLVPSGQESLFRKLFAVASGSGTALPQVSVDDSVEYDQSWHAGASFRHLEDSGRHMRDCLISHDGQRSPTPLPVCSRGWFSPQL